MSAQAELRRRLKQRDTMREAIGRASEQHDQPLYERRVKSLESIEAQITELQTAADAESSTESRGRRR
jgi:hypothetical protein